MSDQSAEFYGIHTEFYGIHIHSLFDKIQQNNNKFTTL
jgi:hypothetical protein